MSTSHRIGVLGVTCLLVVGVRSAPAEPLELPGKIDSITVYRGQALVTRVVSLGGPAGLHEILVGGLPEQIVPASLHADGADGVEVRSVRYRVRPVEQDVREEVRKLDEQIRETQERIAANERHDRLIAERGTYLDKLEQFTAATANVELSRGVLNAETLEKLSGFLWTERRRLADEELKLAVELRKLRERLELLQRERGVLAAGSSRVMREAVIFADVGGAPVGQLRVRYLVNQATWSPSYNIRTDAGRRGVTVEYHASLQQTSGEDWPDVAMTLSTATPSLVARAPVLAPWTVTLVPAELAKGLPAVVGGQSPQGARREWVLERRKAELARQSQTMTPDAARDAADAPPWAWQPDAAELDAPLNVASNRLQMLDLVGDGKPDHKRDGPREAGDDVVTVTYNLPGRTTLPSRADRQLIQIARLSLAGDFYKVAVPALTGCVYDEALVTNTSQVVLLAGPVSTYVAGEFVGRDGLPTVAAGENFTVGFGIDASLRAARELVDRQETSQGGNRIITLKYRLELENFGPAPAAIRLLERLPLPKGAELKVTIGETSRPPVLDAPDAAAQERQGRLRWDVEVPAQTFGPKALAIEYQFTLEYAKTMTIADLPATR